MRRQGERQSAAVGALLKSPVCTQDLTGSPRWPVL